MTPTTTTTITASEAGLSLPLHCPWKWPQPSGAVLSPGARRRPLPSVVKALTMALASASPGSPMTAVPGRVSGKETSGGGELAGKTPAMAVSLRPPPCHPVHSGLGRRHRGHTVPRRDLPDDRLEFPTPLLPTRPSTCMVDTEMPPRHARSRLS